MIDDWLYGLRDGSLLRTIWSAAVIFMGTMGQVNALEQAPSPRGELNLEQALAMVVENQPRLRAAEALVEAAKGQIQQAERRPNPELEIAVEGFGGSGEVTGVGGAETTLALTQRVETAGKRERRVEVSEAGQVLAAAEVERLLTELRARTHLAFVRVLAAQERWLLGQQRTQVATQEALEIARRVSAGATPPAEAERADLEKEMAQLQERAREGELRSARLELAALWGATSAEFDRVVGVLEVPNSPASLDLLLERIDGSPQVVLADAAVNTARAQLELARKEWVPDVDVMLGARRYGLTQDLGLVAGVSLPLPIWNRNRGRLAAESARAEASRLSRSALNRELQSRLKIAYQALEIARERIDALKRVALPHAERTHQQVAEAHRRGAMRFTDVLDSRRRLFEVKEQVIDAAEEGHLRWAEMEQLVGVTAMNEMNFSEGE